MKTYSFVRENAYKVLYPWNKDDTTGPAVWYEGQMSPRVGSFYQYLYFLFCPTLLYRDHYPRYLKIVGKMNIFNYYCNGMYMDLLYHVYCLGFLVLSIGVKY